MTDIDRYIDTDAGGGGDGSIGDPYNSLASWLANEAGPIGAGDRHIAHLRTPTNPDTSRTNLDNWSGPGELIIQRWAGNPFPIIRPTGTGGHAFQVNSSANKVTLLELEINMEAMTGDSEEGIRANDDLLVDCCIIHDADTSNQDLIYSGFNNVNVATIEINNSFLYSAQRGGILLQATYDKSFVIANTTVWDIFAESVPQIPAVGVQSDFISYDTYIVCVNTAAHIRSGSNSPAFGENPVTDRGTFDTRSDYNLSSDNTAVTLFGATNSIGNVTFQEGTGGSGNRAMFVSLTPGSVDLHILDDAANLMRQNGIGTGDATLGSFVPPFDIDGDPRGATVVDIGADEFFTATGPYEDDFSLSTTTTLANEPRSSMQGEAQLDLSAALAAEGLGTFQGEAQLDLAATLASEALGVFQGEASIGYDLTITTEGLRALQGEFALQTGTALSFEAQPSFVGEISLSYQCGIDTELLGTFQGEFTLAGTLGLVLESIAQMQGEFDLGALLTYELDDEVTGDYIDEFGLALTAGIQAEATAAYYQGIDITYSLDTGKEGVGQYSGESVLGDTLTNLIIDGDVGEFDNFAMDAQFGLSIEAIVSARADVQLDTNQSLDSELLATLQGEAALNADYGLQYELTAQLSGEFVLSPVYGLVFDETTVPRAEILTPDGRTLKIFKDNRELLIYYEARSLYIYREK